MRSNSIGRARKPAARLVDKKARAGQVRQSVVVTEPIGEPVDEDGVQLDAGDVVKSEPMRRQHIAATAHSDDGGPPLVADPVCKVCGVVCKEVERADSTIEPIHRGTGGAVDVHHLLRQSPGGMFGDGPHIAGSPVVSCSALTRENEFHRCAAGGVVSSAPFTNMGAKPPGCSQLLKPAAKASSMASTAG